MQSGQCRVYAYICMYHYKGYIMERQRQAIVDTDLHCNSKCPLCGGHGYQLVVAPSELWYEVCPCGTPFEVDTNGNPVTGAGYTLK